MIVQKPAPQPDDQAKPADSDHLIDLLGIVSSALAKRVNEAPMTKEKAEEISRRST